MGRKASRERERESKKKHSLRDGDYLGDHYLGGCHKNSNRTELVKRPFNSSVCALYIEEMERMMDGKGERD